MEEIYKILAFDGVNAAIKAEERLRNAGFLVRVIPAPAWIKPGCGIALKLPENRVDEALDVLAGIGIDTAVYDINKENKDEQE